MRGRRKETAGLGSGESRRAATVGQESALIIRSAADVPAASRNPRKMQPPLKRRRLAECQFWQCMTVQPPIRVVFCNLRQPDCESIQRATIVRLAVSSPIFFHLLLGL